MKSTCGVQYQEKLRYTQQLKVSIRTHLNTGLNCLFLHMY